MTASNNFRDLLYPSDHPRLRSFRGLDPYTYGRKVFDVPVVAELIVGWRQLAEEPFKGITTDGRIRQGLFALADDAAPVAAMVTAAEALLETLSEQERERLVYPIDAPQWRHWSNPEFLLHPNGLRLEELSPRARGATMEVLRSSLSHRGFEKARGCMLVNEFLGELCELKTIMNQWSYNFLLFGRPSQEEPWGWSIYGHHLILNCFVLKRQLVLSPTFMGAEPNVIDAGPYAGLTLFDDEESIGLELMRSLTPELKQRATVFKLMADPAMPPGRFNPADQRHLGGAFQDNRIVPYEGIAASELSRSQTMRLMDLCGAFLGYLPEGVLSARLGEIERHLDETWWSWIGDWGDDDPFYYRIQSPVVMMEFDHHSGVWLANQEPAKCHIHTVVRTPNGNDYGKDLLRQHYRSAHPGCTPGVG